MWTALIALFLTSPLAQAEPTHPNLVVFASCSCEVLNADGMVIQPREFSGSPLPVTAGFFDVHGVGSLKTDYEKAHCQEMPDGKLSMACAVAAVKAQHNAEYKCGQIAHSYNANNIYGFQNGSVIPDSCYLSVGEEDAQQEWSFTELLKNLNPF